MAQRSESTCLRRLFCGVWRSLAGSVVVRFFVSVIAVWCVCVFFACFFLFVLCRLFCVHVGFLVGFGCSGSAH